MLVYPFEFLRAGSECSRTGSIRPEFMAEGRIGPALRLWLFVAYFQGSGGFPEEHLNFFGSILDCVGRQRYIA